MPPYHRDTYRSGSHSYRIIAEDLLCFSYQFHLLLGIAIFFEYIAVRNRIAVDRVVVGHRPLYALVLVFQLGNRLHPSSGDRLVGRNYDALDSIFAQGCQGHEHLDGRAVRIGNDLILSGKYIGIDLRDNQFFGRIHTPSRRVIHHDGTHLGKLRRPLLGGIPTGGEQSHIGTEGDRLVHPYNFVFLPFEGDDLAD